MAVTKPILEKFHAVDPVLGLPAMDYLHEIDALRHEGYLAEWGKIVDVVTEKGSESCEAMLVKLPADTQAGEWFTVNLATKEASRADGTVAGVTGIAVASALPNQSGEPLLAGYVIIHGHVTAMVNAAVVAGDALTFDPAVPGVPSSGGALAIPNAVAYTDAATLDETPAVHGNLPDYDTGFAEVVITR